MPSLHLGGRAQHKTMCFSIKQRPIKKRQIPADSSQFGGYENGVKHRKQCDLDVESVATAEKNMVAVFQGVTQSKNQQHQRIPHVLIPIKRKRNAKKCKNLGLKTKDFTVRRLCAFEGRAQTQNDEVLTQTTSYQESKNTSRFLTFRRIRTWCATPKKQRS